VKPDYDVIIIGSGAGGSAAAHSLALAGLRTVVLEKGGALPTDGSTLDAGRVVRRGEFVSHEPWQDAAGRPLMPEEHFNVGGKTKWYGAALLRFSAREFQPEHAHGCRDWPLSLADLEPWYARAEQLLAIRKFAIEPDLQRIVQSIAATGSLWRSAPLPMALSAAITDDRREATHFDGFASARGFKQEAQHSLLEPLRSRPNFSLLANTEVVALLGAENDARTIIGVRLRDGRELRAPQVLLGAGALHSPRLLARYLRDSGLEASLPAAGLVGRNLKLHVLTAMVALSLRPVRDVLRKTTLLTHEHYPHSGVQPLGFDAELLATLLPRWLPAVMGRFVGRHAYGFFLQTEDGSDARNAVRDVGGDQPPVLDYDVHRLQPALREHRAFSGALQHALLRAGWISVTRRMGVNGTAHACGTLPFGTDPEHSVVDGDGQVHGLRGLAVVDGSILPRSSRVNPALTIYAWGLRVGARIALGWTQAMTSERNAW
jgi:choline dehydrogenase-like flavoprotein